MHAHTPVIHQHMHRHLNTQACTHAHIGIHIYEHTYPHLQACTCKHIRKVHLQHSLIPFSIFTSVFIYEANKSSFGLSACLRDPRLPFLLFPSCQLKQPCCTGRGVLDVANVPHRKWLQETLLFIPFQLQPPSDLKKNWVFVAFFSL